MAGYIRQSTFVDGDTITAALFNDEYNQLVNAFSNTTGHKHDGTTAEGPVIGLIGDAGETSPNNKVLIDTTNNHIEFYVEVSSNPVQQIYIADGAIVPVTDSDVDLGTSSLYFKDAYIDTVTTTGNVSVGGNLTVTGNATISGNLTFGDADTDSINLAAEIDSHIVPNTDDTYDLGTSTKQWRNLYIDGTAEIDTLAINGTTVTSTAAELNILDGVTSTAAELNILDGVTSTAAELNILDGVTSTTAELNILDGVTSTATELNIVDGNTAATSTTLADADRVVVNDAGTMKQVALTDFETYFESALDTLSNVTTVGALNAGSITSGFGAIDNGSSAITTTGTVTYGNLSDGTITITAFVDEDDMSSNSATLVPTQQSVKAYVDSQVTAQDLDFQGDTGGALSIDLDSESLTIAGGTGIDTSGATNTLTVAIDSTVATLTGTQTLTNKTLTSPDVNTPDIDGGTIDGTVIGGATPAAGTFTTLTANTSITGTLATAAQPNITSVGTLTTLTVDDITINGSTISDAGDLDFDVGGDIILNADGGDIRFRDGATEVGSIVMDDGSNTFILKSAQSDADIKFNGNDGGSGVTALTLDMSDAGKAIFNAGAVFSDAVLVGKTSENAAIAGTILNDTGDTYITAEGSQARVLYLNRLTSDGTIIDLRKDGTAVGSIGAYNSATAILSGSAGSYSGLYLNTNKIEPVGNNFGSEIRVNDTIDIGSSTYKFKDLYLSGAANIGTNAILSNGTLTISQGSGANYSTQISTEYAFPKINTRIDAIAGTSYEGQIFFRTSSGGGSATERMRIDSSGNLLVGTTTIIPSSTSTTEGISLATGSYGGFLSVSRDGGTAAAFNRMSSDGEILDFRKDGSKVGSIGSLSGTQIVIDSAGNRSGLRFEDNGILPRKNQAMANGTVSLGNSSYKFSDIHFSGTINGVGISSNITNFAQSILISNDATTGTLSSASSNTGLGWNVFDDLTSGDNNTAVGALAMDVLTTGSANVGMGHNALGGLTTGSNNVAIGKDSLEANTTASNNTAVGKSALGANTTGDLNVAVGSASLDANTTGLANNAFGYDALGANQTGGENNAFGRNALGANTGNGNSAFGHRALQANTSGIGNVAMGHSALTANTTASNNTAVGKDALTENLTGTANTAVGAYSSDAINIGYNNTSVGFASLSANTSASNNTAIGASALLTNQTGSQNVAVGSASLDALTTGANNTALGYESAGKLTTGTDNVAIGRAALLDSTTHSGNVAVGVEALENNTADNNVAVGKQSLRANTTGTTNTAVGYASLLSNTTGQYNTALGKGSLYTNTTGISNVALGIDTLYFNTTASYNTAVGSDALKANTTGAGNTALGSTALDANTTADANTAIGEKSLTANTTGASNTGVGQGSLENNTTASDNTAVGRNALNANTTGHTNTAVGKNSMVANTTGTYNTAVGNNSLDANTSGGANAALGFGALGANTVGNQNVAVGADSLDANTSGGDNTAVGQAALTNNTTASNNTAVGKSALAAATSGASNTVIGRDAGSTITTGSGNTIIGRYDGNGSGLDIRTSNNNIVLSDGDGNPKYASRTGIVVSTSAVQLAYTVGVGGAYVISAYNQSGGAQGVWFITARGSTVNVVSADNGTGLTVAFTATNYGTLNMATSSGTLVVSVTAMN